MHHFFEAITNTSGDSLIGYFARVIDPATQGVVTLASDENGTPIVSVSSVANMAKTDDYGNLSFYVVPGTYHLYIYAADATTFVFRVSNVAMNSTKGDKGDPGDQGDPGESGPADNTYTTMATFKASDIARHAASLVGVPGVPDGRFFFETANAPYTADDFNIIKADSTALTVGAWVRQKFSGLSFGSLEPQSSGIGTQVLQSVTSGVRNTGFGYQALKSNTSGNENTAFGYLALSSVTGGADPVGNYNTAFGSYALASMTTGHKNVAFGRASSDILTTGSENTALGYGSFHWATTALNCTAVGFEAVHGADGTTPLTAQGITGVGWRALYACVADFNTAVGVSAGAFITTGQRNTMMGVNALNQMVIGSDNTAAGYGAGLNNLGSGNIFIGASADAAGAIANVTVIGTAINATLNNTLYLGNGQTVVPGTSSADFGSQANPWNYGIFGNSLYAQCSTAIPAGGATGKGFLVSSTANFGIFFGVGAPTLSAARGSLYLRSDGSGTNDRMYVNADNGTTWTAVTTAS